MFMPKYSTEGLLGLTLVFIELSIFFIWFFFAFTEIVLVFNQQARFFSSRLTYLLSLLIDLLK